MTALGAEVWQAERAGLIRTVLAPFPKETVSEWADNHRILPRGSPEEGEWRTSRTPYLREIMDAYNDPLVHRIVFRKSSQIGGTEAGNNIVGYSIDRQPSRIIIAQPTDGDARDYSKEQLGPMLEETPCLASKVSEWKSRDSANTIQRKKFPGGYLVLIGANAPTGFRRRSARVIFLDEVDGYPREAGDEGDQVELALNRTTAFANPKIFIVSTPLLRGFSRIDNEYKNSDQRLYHVPCPHCLELQPLSWFPDKQGRGGLHWEELQEPCLSCIHCAALIPETKKAWMVRDKPMGGLATWVPQNSGHPNRGYDINALYSKFPGVRWPNLVTRWLEAQTEPAKLQVFYNTVLGESYEMPGGVDPTRLSERKESYKAPVPKGVGVLTMGIDVQADRIEGAVKGWGVGEESWLIDRFVLFGDTTGAEVWKRLDAQWQHPYECEVGGTMRVDSTAIDFGFNAEMVMRWARPKHGRKVYAVKGSSEAGKSIAPRRATVKMKHGGRGYQIGTDTAKDLIFARMRIQPPRDGSPMPGLMHFPEAEWCDADYFGQLTSEKPVKELVRGVYRRRYVCPEGMRNEALDLEVYAVAAFYLGGLKPEHLVSKVAKVEEKAEAAKVKAAAPAVTPEPEDEEAAVMAPRRQTPSRRTGWAKRWKL